MSMDATSISFRQFRSSDYSQVIGLHEAALRDAGVFIEQGGSDLDADLNDIEGVYINDGGDFLVGEIDGEIVAMGAFKRISEKVAELKRMRVRTDLQGQGIGKSLLNLLEAEIRQRGFGLIQLDTSTEQAAAISLYQMAGFHEVRRTNDAYPGQVTIFYEKELITRRPA